MPTSGQRAIVVCVVLALATFVVYVQVAGHDFGIDSGDYLTDNPHVIEGLSGESLGWVWTATHAHNWQPLTWLSHMADVELFGLEPGGHHMTSLLLHLANTVLLLLVLRRMTGDLWPSALVAGLFALHPLHVESVAWLLERNLVLSTLFWLLTLWAYVRYAEKPGGGRYLLVLFAFVPSLMSKAMPVTLPFALLLLDYWPLRRVRLPRKGSASRLLIEKLPMIALSVAVAVTAWIAQGESLATLDQVRLVDRLDNALVSYVVYLRQTFWPAGLAFFYPYSRDLASSTVAGVALLLGGISAACLALRRRFPFLPVGWFWYLGTLVPVIGLVQLGGQAHADRYTYVPLIGIFVMIAWGAQAWIGEKHHRRLPLTAAGAVVLILLALGTARQLRYWKDSVTLLERSASVTHDNYFASYNLANHWKRAGRLADAAGSYLEALRVRPESVDALYNLGNTLRSSGDLEGSVARYREVLGIEPDHVGALHGLGAVRMRQGRLAEALRHLEQAASRKQDPEILNDLGAALLAQGRIEAALPYFREALRLQPDARRHNSLGVALQQRGDLDEAREHFRRALEIDPDYEKARRNLAARAQ